MNRHSPQLPTQFRLQPLRIPAGWAVEYNDFREVDATAEAVGSLVVREDLLQLRHLRSGVVVDLGWYGDERTGQFLVLVHAGGFDGDRLHEVRGRDRTEITREIEALLERLNRA